MKYDISAKYQVNTGVYDELFDKNNQPRKTTQILLDRLNELGYDEAERRHKRLNYTQYYRTLAPSDNTNTSLDSVPLFITKEEWKTLRKGLIQRAKVFDMLADDIYGEQKIIKDKIVPPALIFANPDFLQMIWTGKSTGKGFISLMSTDVVRRSNGSFVAVNDRFQIPEGLGSAIENRLSLARSYPEFLHDLNVKRQDKFFDDLRQSLLGENPNDEANAVLLASEPERYQRTEDSILARHLKLQLVENDDLSVRGFNVYLKTLSGLQKIDTIFRRVEDGMCDPLELRIDSGEGAVGLISAVRSGNVKILNGLGTGILETPIVRAFLPKIAKYFLNEDLILEPVKSYWLGEEKYRKEILANLDNRMFYNAFGKTESWIYEKMTMTAQLSLTERILQNPPNFTAEEYVKTSTTPYVSGDGYAQGDAHFRFYTSKNNDDFEVLTGGYGWVTDDNGKKVIEKDIWVLGDNVSQESSKDRKNFEILALSRAGGDLPSRTADNFFKLGQNLEHADLLARNARSIAKRLADRELCDLCAPVPYLLKVWQKDLNSEYEFENTLWNLVMKKTEDKGLQPVCKQIRFLAIQLRERIAEDTWQFIKSFGEHKLPEGKGAAALLPYLQRMIADSAAFQGLISDGMTRGHGWRFLDLGKRLEHGIITLKIIKNLLKNKTDNEKSMLNALLAVGDGSLTYFRRYGTKLNAAAILDLLLCDESNPHSVAFHAMEIEKIVNQLPLAKENVFLAPLDREILRLTSALRLADVHALVKDENGRRSTLSNYCDERIKEFENIGELLSREYLNHIPQKGIKTAMATEV